MSLRTIIVSILFGIAASQFLAYPLDGASADSALMGREILLLLSSLPIFLAVLGFGQLAGLLTLTVAILLNFLSSTSGLLAIFTLFNGMPALFLGSVALLRKITAEEERPHGDRAFGANRPHTTTLSFGVEWVSGELIVLALVFLGMLAVITMLVVVGLSGTAEPVVFLTNLLQEVIKSLISPMTMEGLVKLVGDPKIVDDSIRMMARYPAILVLSWLLVLALNGILAQGLLMRFNESLRPAPAIGQISMPYWYSSAAIVLAILSFAGTNWLGFVASNLLLVVAIGLLFAGLGVVHLFSLRWSYRLFWLVLGYGLLVLSQGFLMVPLVIIGMIMPFVRMRQRVID